MNGAQRGHSPLARSELAQLDPIDLLRLGGVQLEPGLTEEELRRIEHTHGFNFNPTHAAMLGAALPVQRDPAHRQGEDAWPDWRTTPHALITRRLAVPTECVLSVLHTCAMWLPQLWGPRPAETATANAPVQNYLTTVPQLVPLTGHRWLPETCGLQDPPVISLTPVAPFDPVFISVSLKDDLARTVGLTAPVSDVAGPAVSVPFWSHYIQWAAHHWADPTCPTRRES